MRRSLEAAIYLCSILEANSLSCFDAQRVQIMRDEEIPLTNRWTLTQPGAVYPGQSLSFYAAEWQRNSQDTNGTVQCYYATSSNTPASDITIITYYQSMNEHAVLTWLPQGHDSYTCLAPHVGYCQFDPTTPASAAQHQPKTVTTYDTSHRTPSIIRRQPPRTVSQHLDALRLLTFLSSKMQRGFHQFATNAFPSDRSYKACLTLWHTQSNCAQGDRNSCDTYNQQKQTLDNEQQDNCLIYMRSLSRATEQQLHLQNVQKDSLSTDHTPRPR